MSNGKEPYNDRVRWHDPVQGHLAIIEAFAPPSGEVTDNADTEDRFLELEYNADWTSMGDRLKHSWPLLKHAFKIAIARIQKKYTPDAIEWGTTPKETTQSIKATWLGALKGLGSIFAKWLLAFATLAARLVIAVSLILIAPFYAMVGAILNKTQGHQKYGLHTIEGQNWFLNLALSWPKLWTGKNMHSPIDCKPVLTAQKTKVTIALALLPLSAVVGAIAYPFVAEGKVIHNEDPTNMGKDKKGKQQRVRDAALMVFRNQLVNLFAPSALVAHIAHAIWQTLLYGISLILRQPAYLLAPITLAFFSLGVIQVTQFLHISHLAWNPLNMLINALSKQVFFEQALCVSVIMLIMLISLWILLQTTDQKNYVFPWKAALLCLIIGITGAALVLLQTLHPQLMLTQAHIHTIGLMTIIASVLMLTFVGYLGVEARPRVLPEETIFKPKVAPQPAVQLAQKNLFLTFFLASAPVAKPAHAATTGQYTP